MNKKISIVIPCRNEKSYIALCLDSLINNDYPNDLIEIIVIDGESNDGTQEILKQYETNYHFIKVISNPHKITPVALNLGIKNATKEYILIVSAHSAYPDNYITTLMKYISDLKADVVGGIIKTSIKNPTKKALSIVKVLSNKFGVGNSMFRIGINKPMQVDTVPYGIYKKELFNKIGLYDEKLIRNHDIELSKRIVNSNTNRKIYLIPDVVCTYYAREKYLNLAKNNYQNGLWNILTVYITKNINSLGLRHFIPIIYIFSLIIPVILAILISKYFIYLTLLSFLCYNILVIIISIKLNDRTTSFFHLFWSFYVLHFSYGIGSFIGLFKINKLFTKNVN